MTALSGGAAAPGAESHETARTVGSGLSDGAAARPPCECHSLPMVKWGLVRGRQRWMCVEHARAHGRQCHSSERGKATRREWYARLSESQYAHFRHVNIAARRRRAERADTATAGGTRG